MNGRAIEKNAWNDFARWCKQWALDHPDDERDIYELSLIYGEVKGELK